MRLYVGPFVIISIIIIIDIVFYLFFLRNHRRRKTWFVLTAVISLAYSAFWIFLFSTSPKTYRYLQPDNYQLFFLALTILVVFYMTRLASILFKLLLLIPQNINILKQKFINRFALILGAVLLIISISSIYIIRFQFRVIKQTVEHSSIPKGFNNFKIVQISDLHLGTSKGNKLSYVEMVKEINKLTPNIVVFTGDLVNNFASELNDWDTVLNKIQSNLGTYAILGNHDYGDYVKWTTPNDKQQNFSSIVSFFKTINWNLLRNESIPLVNGSDTIMLAGVENWGNLPFPRYGKLNKAVSNISPLPIILLSHDPSHWNAEVVNYPANIFLTLSGHTHGFQFGVRSQSMNISPGSLKYKKWGGLYESNQRFLYINVGAGTVAFPGRIGMRPEITLITLKHKP